MTELARSASEESRGSQQSSAPPSASAGRWRLRPLILTAALVLVIGGSALVV